MGSGTGNGTFNQPYGVAADSSGNVYVADTNNALIQKFSYQSPSGPYTFALQWGGNGSGNGQLEDDYDVAVDPTGNTVYTVDANINKLQAFSSIGGFQAAVTGNFDFPYGLAVDSNYVYVADTFHNQIQRFDRALDLSSAISWGSSGSGNSQFCDPRRLATDSSGNVYVSDQCNFRFQKFDANGNYICQVSDKNVNGNGTALQGIALDQNQDVYVANNNIWIDQYIPCGTSGPISLVSKSSKEIRAFTSTPTPTVTSTPTVGCFSVVAVPNLSRYGEPVHLRFNLVHPASVRLTIYNLLGELVNQQTAIGNGGSNDLVWNLDNKERQTVASGLYIYSFLLDDGKNHNRYTGKILVIH